MRRRIEEKSGKERKEAESQKEVEGAEKEVQTEEKVDEEFKEKYESTIAKAKDLEGEVYKLKEELFEYSS